MGRVRSGLLLGLAVTFPLATACTEPAPSGAVEALRRTLEEPVALATGDGNEGLLESCLDATHPDERVEREPAITVLGDLATVTYVDEETRDVLACDGTRSDGGWDWCGRGRVPLDELDRLNGRGSGASFLCNGDNGTIVFAWVAAADGADWVAAEQRDGSWAAFPVSRRGLPVRVHTATGNDPRARIRVVAVAASGSVISDDIIDAYPAG